MRFVIVIAISVASGFIVDPLPWWKAFLVGFGYGTCYVLGKDEGRNG